MADNGASGIVRVKLDLRSVVSHRGPHNLVWIIIDRSKTATIGQFARLVRFKYYGIPENAELYLDDALLPHGEPIAMLKDNDTVRVVEATKQPSSNSGSQPNTKAEPSSVTDQKVKTCVKQEHPGSSNGVDVVRAITIKLESSDSDSSHDDGPELSPVMDQPIKREVKCENPGSSDNINVVRAMQTPSSDSHTYDDLEPSPATVEIKPSSQSSDNAEVNGKPAVEVNNDIDTFGQDHSYASESTTDQGATPGFTAARSTSTFSDEPTSSTLQNLSMTNIGERVITRDMSSLGMQCRGKKRRRRRRRRREGPVEECSLPVAFGCRPVPTACTDLPTGQQGSCFDSNTSPRNMPPAPARKLPCIVNGQDPQVPVAAQLGPWPSGTCRSESQDLRGFTAMVGSP
ncbi:hypothetical protein MTO96_021131 [Rhipicephalus appendiculatus]